MYLSKYRNRDRHHREISIILDHIHVKGDGKSILDREMKRLCYLSILKEVFLAYSSPVMLISRKVKKDIQF